MPPTANAAAGNSPRPPDKMINHPRFWMITDSRDNLRRDELKALRLLADEVLAMDDADLRAALANETIVEVPCDG